MKTSFQVLGHSSTKHLLPSGVKFTLSRTTRLHSSTNSLKCKTLRYDCYEYGSAIRDNGRLPFDQKIRNFRNGDKWYENFLRKVPENPEIVEFPKSEPFNRKFRKFRDESQMERKFPGKKISKIWVYLTLSSSFSEFMQIRNFLVSAG